jgi:hypothetical protein
MGIWSWLIGAFGGCEHEWVYSFNEQLRKCRKCERMERFESDAGGWTAGHWDEVR